MFEQDYIMRLIKEMIRAILKLLFYSYLNDKSDDFLLENNFSRKELQDDLKCILSQYGLESMAELFCSS